MNDRLLVRMYNVGLGDCIYLRVPDLNQDVHILIDCGNKFDKLTRLEECIEKLKRELPEDDSGKRRLDLLVVTHPHEDHHKGFEWDSFGEIKIKNIWLSPAFNRQDPKAQGFHSLQDTARRALLSFSRVAFGETKEQVDDLLSLTNRQASDMLCYTLPEKNGIQPLYVSADTAEEQLRIFEDPKITLKVLAPMGDIDAYYLGGEGLVHPEGGLTPQGIAEGYQAIFPDPGVEPDQNPMNISTQDFRKLRNSIHANVFALASIAGHAVNNLSVVLLLEWRGFRLLFPGDAEWNGASEGQVRAGRFNGSWNVMWQERRTELSQPLDFLKIGHHGSENATPWTAPNPEMIKEHPINQILDSLLPRPQGNERPRAKAIASTFRTPRWGSIPNPALMEEIGKRVANAITQYVEEPSPHYVKVGVPQPQRTDLEAQLTATPEKPVPFIEVEFPQLGTLPPASQACLQR